jgi:hypothetical protein
MPAGAPRYRITPDPAAPAQGPGQWAVQPSGPMAAIPGLGTPGRKARRGAQMGRVGLVGVSQISSTSPGAAVDPTAFLVGGGVGERVSRGPFGLLPRASTLDYAHKLTTTSLLLIGLVGYLLFGPKRLRPALRQLAGKHVAG